MANVKYKTWSIGPRHDPYGAHELTVTTTAGKVVSYYADGLDNVKVKVDGEVAASGIASNASEAQVFLDLFEEHAGISYDAAMKAWERIEALDPFSGFDPYYGHA